MTLPAGTRFGSFEVIGPIGAGGMGQVYRARDTALGRDVALKVLPPAFAQDAERVARFRREAQLLAALSHQNIGAIFGLESSGGVAALALEFIDGEDLSARISRGPVPIDEAIAVARQIAAGLEFAHESGIVHRDLKPGNVKLRPDGVVKVLDFGLAVARTGAPSTGSGSEPSAATITSPAMTAMGMIIGTAAYMSPEQAKGRPVDKRADIWAFGVVLFEMLTGRQLFAGETVSEVLAAVLRQEIDWARLPRETPPRVRRLLERCLDRDPQTRLRDIGEARIALSAPDAAEPPASQPAARTSRALVYATTALAIALAIVTSFLWRGQTPATLPVSKFDVAPPDGSALSLAIRPAIAVASDGSVMVFAATREGVTRLYVRRRGEIDAVQLAGSEGASSPAVSPDGRSVAFFANNTLKVAPFEGPVTTIVSSGVNDPRGLTWIDSSTIAYAPGAAEGLMRVDARGGTPAVLTTLDPARNERSHRWPVAIAGGRAVAFTVGTMDSPDNYDNAPIDAVLVATGERRKEILKGASYVVGAADHRLVFARGGVLHAVPFDPDRLATSGSATAVVHGVAGDSTTGAVHASLAPDGTLIYVPGEAGFGTVRRLVWVDSVGTIAPLPGLADALYNDVRISPDGTKIAVLVGPSGSGDVWLYDAARSTFTRLTFTGVNSTPLWSSDGRTVYYMAIESTGLKSVIWRRLADGSREPEQVATVDSRANLTSLEKDAGIVDYYGLRQDKTNSVRIPFAAGAKPETLVGTKFDEYAATVSPEGRWLAYQSDETGRFEVYVRDLLPNGGRYQVSTTLGEEPKWSADGKTLYYRSDQLLMAVPVNTRGAFSAGTARVYFKDAYNLRSDTGVSFDVDPKHDRLVMIRPATERKTPPVVRVVLNWFEELRQRGGK